MARALLDTNVLVHATYRASPLHGAAASLVGRGLRERHLFCIAPQNIVEFSAVVTRARFVDPPLSSADAAGRARLLYRSRKLSKIYPQRGTVMRALREGAALGITGAAWYDLFLAVTMKDAGVSLIVTENLDDFRRFPFISTRRIQDEAIV
ncbi:MAG: type II toxin-antitoxin system VapC family toxin [Planctomycetes bacterium]|nr:type II toxin-antitoxin system VapC family toxin [Planctomycetota bacterium]